MLNKGNGKIGAVLVVGGGVTGMQAALDLANSGFKVYLVEKASSIGGRMSQLDKTFPTNDCSMCLISPKLIEVAKHRNIELITNAEIEALEGEEGNFTARVLKKPRYIDIEKCTDCGNCVRTCPVELRNEFEMGLNKRKAIYKSYPQAIPGAVAISKGARPPCKLDCPAGCNVQGFISLFSKGRYSKAQSQIKQSVPFPAVMGRICYHPCEGGCNRSDIDEPLGIAHLERFVADTVRQKCKEGSLSTEKKAAIDPGKSRVAVVGAGPSGLTCAYDLIKQGYPVTIFEAASQPGGQLQWAIPEYRLPKDVLAADIQDIIDLGIELKLNTSINSRESLHDLKAQGYKAIYLAIGAQHSLPLAIPGADLRGVLQALDFLKNVILGQKVELGKRVAVTGGENAAIEAARVARRLGSEDVTIIYRRTQADMPASPVQIEEARREGVKFRFLATPLAILAEHGHISAVRCGVMKLSELDESGSRNVTPVAGSEFDLPVDNLIIAEGQTVDKSALAQELDFTSSGMVSVDTLSLQTNIAGVFAGGDCVTGPRSAVEAVAHGHAAALSIERYLSGKDLLEDRQNPNKEKAPTPAGKHPKRKGVSPNVLPLETRLAGFDEINSTYSEEQAKAEALRCLDCGLCSECLQCELACQPKAIDHAQKAQHINLAIGSVIVAPGFDTFDATLKGEYGYGRMKNVVTTLEFERMLSASGPFQGQILRPSDGKHPLKIGWIQCVGSRDVSCGHDYCSSVCCMQATKEAVIAREHDKNIQPTVFYNDIRAFGKGFERYYESAKSRFGVRYINSMPSTVKELQRTSNLVMEYTDENGTKTSEEFDLVVLAVGMVPAAGTRELAQRIGIALDRFGFCSPGEMTPNMTSRPGVYVAGAFSGPMDIPESVMSASGAACLASQAIHEARGTLVSEKMYPMEKDITAEEARIGVFICRCGTNISRVIDVPAVVEYARSLPNVVHAEENLYMCSTDTQDRLIKAIKEWDLNRIVVASCSPRTHEPLFQDTIQEGGLNKYLFEMANIRDQCSWVHATHLPQSTTKARDLVRMAVARAATLLPLHQSRVGITRRALIIGGGLAGLTAAQAVAAQGIEAIVVEKGKVLGGNLRRIYYTEQGADLRSFLATLIKQVESDPLIKVFKSAEVKNISGYLGNYVAEIVTGQGKMESLEHGVIIIATGGAEYKPAEYFYGQAPNVLTQLELQKKLADGDGLVNNLKSVVMIQCVGSREAEHQYCSRVCCNQAINNAIRLKEINPDIEVAILYRDIRSYGMHELQYRKGRELGIIFIRFNDEIKPEAALEDGRLAVKVMDKTLNREIRLGADLLVLSTAIRPQPDAVEFANKLKLPLTQDRFIMEAHMKLRPLDLTNEGMYLCGLAHSPKNISESIVQARGAVSRALTVLSQPYLMVGGVISTVKAEKCAGCLTCVRACPYHIPQINAEGVACIEAAACQGCGICAGACPRKAITLQHYSDEQVIAKTSVLCGSA